MKKMGIQVLRSFARDFDEIKDKGWKKFTSHLEATVLLMVRDFYVNVKERGGDFVFI